LLSLEKPAAPTPVMAHLVANAGIPLPSTKEQSRWTANSARSKALTFDSKGEIIILSSGAWLCPQS
jgi:hypothetical protein